MKKLLVAIAAVSSVAAVMVGAVSASGDGGTIVARGFECAVLDNNGNPIITTNSTITLFQTKAVLRCSSNDAGTGKPLQIFNFGNTGLLCNVGDFGTTEDWSDKVGYNGNSQLVCTVAVNGSTASASSGGAGIG
jgi:hypothetical protein